MAEQAASAASEDTRTGSEQQREHETDFCREWPKLGADLGRCRHRRRVTAVRRIGARATAMQRSFTAGTLGMQHPIGHMNRGREISPQRRTPPLAGPLPHRCMATGTVGLRNTHFPALTARIAVNGRLPSLSPGERRLREKRWIEPTDMHCTHENAWKVCKPWYPSTDVGGTREMTSFGSMSAGLALIAHRPDPPLKPGTPWQPVGWLPEGQSSTSGRWDSRFPFASSIDRMPVLNGMRAHPPPRDVIFTGS